MKKLLLLSILLCGLASAAITERYVSVAGSGAADGTSAANAMSMATFEDYMATGGSFNAGAGDRFNVLAGTYARTTTSDSWANTGTVTSPIIVRGYTTTIGDGYQGRTNGSGALITTNMPLFTRTTGLWTINTGYTIIEGISFAGTRSTTAISVGVAYNTFRGCKFTSAGSGSGSITVTTSAVAEFFDCDLSLTNGGNAGTSCISLGGTGSRIINCRITSSAVGVASTNSGLLLLGNVIYDCTGNGVNVGTTNSTISIINNTIVGGGADGINVITGNTLRQTILGNNITDNTGFGLNMVSTANYAITGYNHYRDNVAGSYGNQGDSVTVTSYGSVDNGTTGTTATDYVNYAGKDYRLLSTSPATSTGFFPSASIGALQRLQTGAATSSAFAQ